MKTEVDNPKHSNGNGNIEKATPPVELSKSVAENPSETSIETGIVASIELSKRVTENLSETSVEGKTPPVELSKRVPENPPPPETVIGALPAVVNKLIENKALIIYPFWILAFLSILDKAWREDIKQLYMWAFDEPEPIVTWIIALLQNNF